MGTRRHSRELAMQALFYMDMREGAPADGRDRLDHPPAAPHKIVGKGYQPNIGGGRR